MVRILYRISGDAMQTATTLFQIMTQLIAQMATLLSTPIFGAMAILLAVQIGMTQKKNQKQAVVKLSAFLFAILESWIHIMISGMAGGLVAGSLLLLTGVAISYRAMLYLWITMLILCMMRRRFFCFAYAGGVLVLIQSIMRCCGMAWPDIDAAAILLFVAILHFTEALLVKISGTVQQMPVYFRSKTGNITEKTQMQVFWPIPLVMPVPLEQAPNLALCGGCLVMPEWWPLFGASQIAEAVVLYQLMPVLAVIGYSDFAIPGREHMQTRKSSRLLVLYSIILSGLIRCSHTTQQMLVIAALFAILGHEWILHIGTMDMRKYVHSKKEQ